MNKFLSALFLTAIIIAGFAGCEKDDICPPDLQTTPMLVVGFYDVQEADVLKAVPKLRAGGVGQEFTVNTFNDRTDQTTILLPLRTTGNTTDFVLINNSASDTSGAETGNADFIRFSYQIQERFVSRGCGYAVSYSNLQANVNPDGTDNDRWINAVLVEQEEITNQDTVHVKIFH